MPSYKNILRFSVIPNRSVAGFMAGQAFRVYFNGSDQPHSAGTRLNSSTGLGNRILDR